MKYKYKHGVLGGTFDRLHLGHIDLLTTAFKLSEKVTIGLGTEEIYAKKHLPDLILPYPDRLRELTDYLESKEILTRAEIIQLNDIYGPTLAVNDIESVFVTDNTLSNALYINKKREKIGLPPLEIINVPLRKDENGEVITSEKIRLGRINRDGLVYMNIFENKQKLILPPELRIELRQPIGEIVKEVKTLKFTKTQNALLISVGDIVTKSLNDINCQPDIAIIDLRTRRHAVDQKFKEAISQSASTVKLKNEAGMIQKSVVDNILQTINTFLDKRINQSIIIDGEEDLLTLPAILLAPLNSTICYGQFDLNAMIIVEVTEEKKKTIYDLLKKFE